MKKRRRKGINVELGLRLKVVREDKQMTQAQVAKHLRVHRSSYVNIERGRQNVTLDMLTRLAVIYGVPVSSLLSGVSA